MSNGLESSCPCPPVSVWNVTQLINTEKNPNHRYAVMVLNRPLTQNEDFLVNFWNNATIRVTVDGGTRQWDSYLGKLAADVQNDIKQPDFITGDFDSITEEIMEKYKTKGCQIFHTPDQDFTDFTKALLELREYCLNKDIEVNDIVVFGQSSGRLDQILGIIQTLYIVKEKSVMGPKQKVYLISDDAVSWLLEPGDHTIKIPKETRSFNKSWCSLVPVGEPCESVTTKGLKWNLIDQPLRFGDLVSTSNTFDGSESVSLKCSHTLLWSMRIPSVGNLPPASETADSQPIAPKRTSDPATSQPIAPKPHTSDPPTSQAPTNQSPTSQVPTSKPRTSQQPTNQPPSSQVPTSQQPTNLPPTSQVPKRPSSQVPTSNLRTSQQPTNQPPTSQVPKRPSSQVPTSNPPTSQQPTNRLPTSQVPTSQQPTNQPPTSQVPIRPSSQVPTSNLRTSQQPTNQPPTSQVPTSQQPTNQPPTSQVPTSNPPTSQEPTPKPPQPPAPQPPKP